MWTILFVLATACLVGCTTEEVQNYESYVSTIEVNGQRLLYAAEGHGKPIILLHGNSGSHSDLELMMRQLAQKGYTVYALDSRGQGANPPLAEYHYADMAEDTYQFINSLHLGKPAVFGWSDGGIIALMTEVMHPGTFSVIASSGANTKHTDVFDMEALEELAQQFGKDPFTSQMSPLEEMMFREPDMTTEELQTIKCPTLICAGQYDVILRSHTEYIAQSIPNSTLFIVEGHDHVSHILNNPLMGNILLDYFRKVKY